MTGYQPYEVLVLALDGGEPFAQAARNAGLSLTDATREAKAFGYPDLEILRGVAAEIRSEHSREESTTMNPRRPASVPIEDDVAEAIASGAASIREARASVALDRDQTHEVVDDPAVVVDPTTRFIGTDEPVRVVEEQLPTWRAAGVTDADLGAWSPEASVESVDREVLDGTQALLQLFGEMRKDRPLDDEQRARALALKAAADITKDIGPGPSVADLLDLADYIVTGTVPIVRAHS